MNKKERNQIRRCLDEIRALVDLDERTNEKDERTNLGRAPGSLAALERGRQKLHEKKQEKERIRLQETREKLQAQLLDIEDKLTAPSSGPVNGASR